MPEKTTPSPMALPSNNCICCPYGFHIDRDFVRFCDTLYNSAQLEKLRQHKREKRKENKTVESYLGIGNSISLPNKKEINVVTEKWLPCDSYLESDDLKDAVNDFEDTWQRSLKKSSNSYDLMKKQRWYNSLPHNSNILNAGTSPKEVRKEFEHKNDAAQSRSSSSSSVSSKSAFSSFNATVFSDDQNTFLSSDHTSAAVACLSNQNLNSAILKSGVQKSVLTAIRQQMASSLSRLKELEEQVKCIPLLQGKLCALEEEKKKLLKQLQFNQYSQEIRKKATKPNNLEAQLKRLENQGIMSPTLVRKCLLIHKNENNLISPVIASELESVISKKHFIENEIISQMKVNQRKKDENVKVLKTVGTSCSVLTRDIGTGYIPNKLKSVSVGCDTLCNNCSYRNMTNYGKYVDVSSESIESDLESFVGSDEQSKSSLSKSKSSLKNTIKRTVTYKNYTDSFTSMNLVYTHKSTNTDIAPTLFSAFQKVVPKPSTRSKCIQVTDLLRFCNKSAQTLSILNYSKIAKTDTGVGNFDINELICLSCKKVASSISGESLSDKVECENSFRQSINSGKERTCKTNTIGVGDYDINDICQKCKYDFEKNVDKTQNKCFEMPKDSGFSSNPNLINSDIVICDKCNTAIKLVARGLAANNSDPKISKSNTSATSKTKNANLSKLKISDYENRAVDKKNNKTAERSHLNLDLKPHKNNLNERTKDLAPCTNLNSQEIILKQEYNVSSTPQTLESSGSLEELPLLLTLAASSRKKTEISKEIKAACKVLNDCLQKSDKGKEKKALSSLAIIQNEWFKVANQKNADPHLIEDYLDLFEEFSKHLLEKVVNLSDNNGNTALHYAVSYGNFDVVTILIDSKVCDVNKKNKAGYTSIMLVALADIQNDTHQYVIQRLFSIGDINTKASQNGQTALMLAVSHGKRNIVKLLLDASAEINLQDKDGSTALMCAAEHGHLEIVKLLLSYPECDPTIIDNDNCTALTIAMEAGHKDIGLLIYTSLNFSRGSSPSRKRSTPRSTPPPRTPTLRTPPLPSPSAARSTNSIPSSFHFSTF